MKVIERIKSWPEKKKRSFAIILAIVLTIVIVGVWYWYDATYNAKNESTYHPNPFASFSGMFSDISNEFHSASTQLASTTAFIKSEIASSTATSTATTSASTSTTQKTAKKK